MKFILPLQYAAFLFPLFLPHAVKMGAEVFLTLTILSSEVGSVNTQIQFYIFADSSPPFTGFF